jgi:hypothetical protein
MLTAIVQSVEISTLETSAQFTDPDPDQKIDERPSCPAEESDGIA